ncbi:DUF551 domain-containing protein [Neisseria dentiae]|uniref:DUF551 domain-containing protein n=1 Tax=Neisseria dentiae TaxID=194197 RepID=UPI00211CD09F|nr:DUF551 domain-containing protein [Neisseria dentiae]MCQ9325545.1 DUF551 domain-containing protein [Neisseria dentiae]
MTNEQLEKEKQAFEEWFNAKAAKDDDFRWEVERFDARLGWMAAKEHAAKQGGWISVEEKLPTEDDQYVLVWETVDGNSGAEQAFFNLPEKTFVNFAGDILKATHWQPLSTPLSEGKQQ